MQSENKKHFEVVAAVIVQKSYTDTTLLNGDTSVTNNNANEKIFCAQRPGPKPGKEVNETNYKWEFPGGKIEKGETRETALEREIREEFGATIEVGNFIMTVEHEYKNFCITMHAFYCTFLAGSPELKEHLESAWVNPKLLTFLDWAAADIPIMKKVQQEIVSKSGIAETVSTCVQVSADKPASPKETDDVSLRLFEESDMKQFTSWLNEPHVKKWYTPASAWIDEVSRRNTEYRWISHYIITANNEDVGFCQFYPFSLSGETWNGTIPTDGTFSLDYLVGNPNLLKQGIARRALCLMCALIHCLTSARRIIVQPETENSASQKTLLSAGFQYDSTNKLYILEW